MIGPTLQISDAARALGSCGSYNQLVTSETETILRNALALRDEDRADLAAQLLASLDSPAVDDPATLGAVWASELDQRAVRVLSGEAATKDWATVRDRVADRLKE
jgi:hypothetical protein